MADFEATATEELAVRRCTLCGELYPFPFTPWGHNCGDARISKDRLHELEAAERERDRLREEAA